MASQTESGIELRGFASLTAFRNEPYADFSRPENRRRMEQAQQKIRARLGREYDLTVAGERVHVHGDEGTQAARHGDLTRPRGRRPRTGGCRGAGGPRPG